MAKLAEYKRLEPQRAPVRAALLWSGPGARVELDSMLSSPSTAAGAARNGAGARHNALPRHLQVPVDQRHEPGARQEHTDADRP
jgi:hypothetical protein